MKKTMILMTLIFLLVLLVSGAIYYFTKSQVIFSATITFVTIFYHFAMRLAVGYLVDAKYHNRMDYTKKWFTERALEQKLYKKIQVLIPADDMLHITVDNIPKRKRLDEVIDILNLYPPKE